MNEWDPRKQADDDYIDPTEAVATPVDTEASNPGGDDVPSSTSTTPLFMPPSNDELFTDAADPVPSGPGMPSTGPPLVPPPNHALFRRTPRRSDVPVPQKPDAPVIGAKPDTGSHHSDRKTAKALAVVAGVITMIGAGAIFGVSKVLNSDDNIPLAEAFPAPSTSSSPPTTSTAPATPSFCADPDPADDIVVTNKPGDRNSGVGVIAAFEHHYYADRDAVKVVETYDPALQMDPAGIQPSIDAVPAGSKHCMTIEPSGVLNEFRVTGELKPPNSGLVETVDLLLFTTAPGPDGWMITSVVDPGPSAA